MTDGPAGGTIPVTYTTERTFVVDLDTEAQRLEDELATIVTRMIAREAEQDRDRAHRDAIIVTLGLPPFSRKTRRLASFARCSHQMVAVILSRAKHPASQSPAESAA